MNLLRHHDWSLPIPIAYGPGRVGQMAEFCRGAGMRKPLLVTDKGSEALPIIGRVLDALDQGGLEKGLYADISPNPRDDEIAAGCQAFRHGRHDGIIAMGGGSGMDGGKAISLLANNDIDLWAFNYDAPSPDMSGERAFPPLICIPTTAGTGAETESTAMITDTTRMMKWCVWHPLHKPSLALLDPELTIGLPRKLTAWTGCDAMIHAIEAYCVPDYHPICDGIALEALALIARWLPQAWAEPKNLEARGGMLLGSCLAGISFLKGLGLVHAISHMVGAEFSTRHGLTNAVALPAVLQFNRPAMEHRVPAMARAMGLPEESFEAFYRAICELLDTLEVPRTLSEIGVPEGCAAQIAEKAMQDAAAGTNPRPVTIEDIEEVTRTALQVGR